MDRNTAIVTFLCCWIIFYLISYYGATISTWSSTALSLFMSIVILNVIYPPSRITTDSADYGLGLYIAIEIIAVLILAIYIIQKAVTDYRPEPCSLLSFKCRLN